MVSQYENVNLIAQRNLKELLKYIQSMVIFNRKDITNKRPGHFINKICNIEAYICLELSP